MSSESKKSLEGPLNREKNSPLRAYTEEFSR